MKTEIKELDIVALLEDHPAEHLTRGEMGTVVFDFGDGVLLVEFSDDLGQTYALLELRAEQLLHLHHIERAEVAV
jgi:Domain of unknown function (DUF4926)